VRRLLLGLSFGLSVGTVFGGCRGQTSDQPPIHPLREMDRNPKYKPEAESHWFPDGRTMRTPPPGTIARGQLKEDDAFYRGVDAKTQKPLSKMPIELTAAVIRRGQERFNIYCTPCHDKTGSGHGLVVQHGFPPPIDLTSDRVRNMPDGEIFQTITHGVRNMPGYGLQVAEQDRWAIISFLRVLGRSQHGVLADVPAELRDKIEPEGGAK
jgi:mono/diheme cytochrome c family protein